MKIALRTYIVDQSISALRRFWIVFDSALRFTEKRENVASTFKIRKYFEWYVNLPPRDCPRESPVFILNGNKCVFRFSLVPSSNLCYELILKLESKHSKFEPFRVNLYVGIKNEEDVNLYAKEFSISYLGEEKVWHIYRDTLQSNLPSDYVEGDLIKFLFFFDNLPDAFLKNTEEIDDKSVQTPSYIDSSFLLESVSKDFSTLLDKGPNHDVEFICGGETIKAHKSVLCCRSEVFASMLRTDMVEGKTGQVKIQDMEIVIFKQFLKYLYSGVLPELTVDTALQFYEAADRYSIDALKKQCSSFLLENMSHENACEVLIIADRHNDQDLKKDIMEYMVKEKIPRIWEVWPDFCKNNSALAIEVLNLFVQLSS